MLLVQPPLSPPPPPLPPYLRVYFLDAPLIKSLVKWTEGDVITLTTCHLCNLLTIINFRKIHLTKLMTLTINKGYHRIRVQFHIISDKVHRKCVVDCNYFLLQKGNRFVNKLLVEQYGGGKIFFEILKFAFNLNH